MTVGPEKLPSAEDLPTVYSAIHRTSEWVPKHYEGTAPDAGSPRRHRVALNGGRRMSFTDLQWERGVCGVR